VATVLIKGLCFKLDDVLSSEARLDTGLYHRVAQKLAKRPGAPAGTSMLLHLLEYQEEGRQSKAWSLLFHDFPQLGRAIRYADLLQLVGKTLPVGTPFQAIPELLFALRRKKIRTAVMAGPKCRAQSNKVAALHLECLFDTVLYTDFFTRSGTAALCETLEELKRRWKDLAPREILYVADDPECDFPAARLAGIHAVRLRLHKTRHEFDEPRAPEETPEREFSTVRELVTALCRNFHLDPNRVLPGEWDYYLKPRPWRFLGWK
jgi:FMN phosphatase YigB (HAD superfamily)